MLERFSERARRALMLARYEAQQLGDRSIAGEHLLLALLREPEIDALASTRHVNLAAVHDEIARGNRRPAHSEPDDEGLGEEARRILQLAGEEADSSAERLVDARHILFAILRDGRSLAASILTAQGITLDQVRNESRTSPVRRAPGVSVALESVSISNGSMEFFCHTLEEALGRPVIDQTGLEGGFDIELPGEAGDLIDRLRRDLGLVLTPGRRPVPWLNVRASG